MADWAAMRAKIYQRDSGSPSGAKVQGRENSIRQLVSPAPQQQASPYAAYQQPAPQGSPQPQAAQPYGQFMQAYAQANPVAYQQFAPYFQQYQQPASAWGWQQSNPMRAASAGQEAECRVRNLRGECANPTLRGEYGNMSWKEYDEIKASGRDPEAVSWERDQVRQQAARDRSEQSRSYNYQQQLRYRYS